MRSLTVLALLGSLAFFAPVAEADMTSSQREYKASAYSLENDELLYVERHRETWSQGKLAEREVTYEDTDGRVIAEKLVQYGGKPAAPSFEMTDYRTGLVESADVEVDSIALFSGIPREGQETRTVELPEQAVVDAGFDAFMRQNFSSIVEGQGLEFDFAVPAARRFFRFELVPRGEVTYRGEQAIRVTMKPAGLFLRLLVDPIELVYDRDGRLLEFRGLSNVADREGERYKARIVFDYSSENTAESSQVVLR